MKKLALIVLTAASLVGTSGVAAAQYGGGYYGDRYYGDRYRERYYDDDNSSPARLPRLKGCRLPRTRLPEGLQRTGLRLQAISRLLKLISSVGHPLRRPQIRPGGVRRVRREFTTTSSGTFRAVLATIVCFKVLSPVISVIDRMAAYSDRQPFSCSMTSPHMATEPIIQGHQ